MTRDRKKLILAGVAYSILALAIAYFGYSYWAVRSAMARLPDTSMGQFIGPVDASKVIVEFMDYRCSYCRAVDPTLREVLKRHPDLRIIFRHYPVYERPSVIDAEVALAAGIQGKFAEAHDILIKRETPMSETEIDVMAESLGLNMARFRSDMKGQPIGYMMISTLDIADALGLRAVPTFIIDGPKKRIVYQMTQGMPTPDTFDKLLEEAYGPDAPAP